MQKPRSGRRETIMHSVTDGFDHLPTSFWLHAKHQNQSGMPDPNHAIDFVQ